MVFDRVARLEMLRERAGEYGETSIRCAVREYPHAAYVYVTGPGPISAHRERHPAFFGSFDWHSCVEMHWVAVRLLRTMPEAIPAEVAVRARTALRDLLTPENLATEVRTFTELRSFERPYGWGWLLTLAHELDGWDDSDGRAWAEAVRPLAELLGGRMAAWLPAMTYPQRTGVHPNTAFAMSRSLDWATARAAAGDPALLEAIRGAVARWFLEDVDYPARYEPSGADFLSAALTEAEVVSRVLPASDFSRWLEGFLSGLARSEPAELFTPAVVADASDGQTAHLHGLNLSRAWAFAVIADRLPEGDARAEPLRNAAAAHTAVSLGEVCGSDYMVEHWLAVYAVLLLGE